MPENCIPFTKKEIGRLWLSGQYNPPYIKDEDRDNIHWQGDRLIRFSNGSFSYAKSYVSEDKTAITYHQETKDGANYGSS